MLFKYIQPKCYVYGNRKASQSHQPTSAKSMVPLPLQPQYIALPQSKPLHENRNLLTSRRVACVLKTAIIPASPMLHPLPRAILSAACPQGCPRRTPSSSSGNQSRAPDCHRSSGVQSILRVPACLLAVKPARSCVSSVCRPRVSVLLFCRTVLSFINLHLVR